MKYAWYEDDRFQTYGTTKEGIYNLMKDETEYDSQRSKNSNIILAFEDWEEIPERFQDVDDPKSRM